MKRSPMPPRRTRLASSGITRKRGRVKPVNRKRKARTTMHAYGPPARRAWLKMLPCAWCRRVATVDVPNDQAHTGKKPGKGLKSHYTTLAPLCPGPDGCHRKYDERLAPFNTAPMRAAVEQYAVYVEEKWQEHLANLNRSKAA